MEPQRGTLRPRGSHATRANVEVSRGDEPMEDTSSAAVLLALLGGTIAIFGSCSFILALRRVEGARVVLA